MRNHKRLSILIIVIFALCFGITFCTSGIGDDDDGGGGGGSTGSVSGTLIVYEISQLSSSMNLSKSNFVLGDVIVKFKDGVKRSNLSIKSIGMNLKSFSKGNNGPILMKIVDKNGYDRGIKKSKLNDLDEKGLKVVTLQIIGELRLRSDVEYAEPNYIRKAFSSPNDQYYDIQWNMPLLNLEDAWDEITTGSDDIIVAVVDTGIRPDHPDLGGFGEERLTDTGYDFISDPAISKDGGGADSVPTDPGDSTGASGSSWHGTHVAGIIGAITENSKGIAGVDWNVKIMPIRVLGKGGEGTDYDIIQGLKYAVGLDNDYDLEPDEPADIINMSLGGPEESSALQEAIQLVFSAGAVLVAASGNSNTNLPDYPAGYPEVISVGAVDINGQKAYYSNYGSTLDIVAPGGDISRDENSDGNPDGILSTLFATEPPNPAPAYGFYQGTSMSAPHIAGVASLILSADQTLSQLDVMDIITTTAVDLGDSGRDDLYGNGLANAYSAVYKAKYKQLLDPILTVVPNSLNFGLIETELQLYLNNGGGGSITINEISTDVDWLTISPQSGPVPLTVTVGGDRTGLSDGNYEGTITIKHSADIDVTVDVTMQVGSSSDISDTIYIIGMEIDTTDCQLEPDKCFYGVTDSDNSFQYYISSISPGEYFIFAGTDRNNDGIMCDVGDLCGAYRTLNDLEVVSINAGQKISDLDFPVTGLSTVESLSLKK